MKNVQNHELNIRVGYTIEERSKSLLTHVENSQLIKEDKNCSSAVQTL